MDSVAGEMAVSGQILTSNLTPIAVSDVHLQRGRYSGSGSHSVVLQRPLCSHGRHLHPVSFHASERCMGVQGHCRGSDTQFPTTFTFHGLRKASRATWTSRRSNGSTWFANTVSNGERITNSKGSWPAAESKEKGVTAVDPSPLVVVGSINADIYVEIERLPLVGETISGNNGCILPGGKGANQAACSARLGHPTYLIAQIGRDTNATLVRDALQGSGVRLDHVSTVAGPTGHAIVMLQPKGKNSIVIVGGANVTWPRLGGGSSHFKPTALDLVRRAGALVLQREIPDVVNLEAAKIARSVGIPVILDCGGSQSPIAEELLEFITILSPNETELARLVSMPTATKEETLAAVKKLFRDKGKVGQVLVKRGSEGSLLISRSGDILHQPAIPAPSVVDTTGAGDTFTASFAVGLLQGMPPADAMRFAAAAATICIQKKGAMPSMPSKLEVVVLLEQTKKKGTAGKKPPTRSK